MTRNGQTRNLRHGTAWMLMAICLLLISLFPCFAEGAERESLSQITNGEKVWDVSILMPEEHYDLQLLMAQEDGIIADLEADDDSLPRMNLAIVRSVDLARRNHLDDLYEMELQAIRDSYLIENEAPTFEDTETTSGEKLLLVHTKEEMDIFLFTIRNGIEIELHLIAGAKETKLSEADLTGALSIINGLEFTER